ncbi:MAG: response regulator [Ruminiclostridium sp.]|nr:response regulator [Ruminiclostridium sp.]
MNKNHKSAGKTEKSTEKNKILAYLFVMLFFVALILIYNALLYSETRKNITENGELSAVRSAEQFDNYLSAGVDALKISEYSIQTLMVENASEEQILEYLTQETQVIIHSLVPNTTGLYAYVNGKYYDGAGWVPDEGYVPTERPWYIKSAANRGNITVVDPYLDMQSGTVMITLAKCMNDGKTVVALDITMDEIQAMIEKQSADNKGMTEMLLCSHGTVVAHSDRTEIGKNYLEEKSGLGSAVTKKLFSEPETCFELNYGGKNHIVYAVGIQDGWYSVSVVEASGAYMPLSIMTLASVIAVISTVFILAVMMISARKKDIIAGHLNIQLSSAADIYMSLCDLDIVNNEATAIKNVNPAIEKAVAACDHNMQEIFTGIMQGLPESPTKQAAVEFCDLSTIDERMKGKNTITLEYLSYGNIWVRARYVVSERDSEGRITHVLWMLENIDSEKRARDKLSQETETLQQQLSSAAGIYISLCDLDILDNTVTAIRNANPAIDKAVSACDHNMQDIFFSIMQGLPESPTKQAAIEFADMATIDERMQDTNTISMEYLSYGNIWVRARYVVSERTPEGKITHVLWMLENIDKEKKARDKLIDMSERAIAASEAKSAFLSNMSHEIRTPINAVLGMNEMVLRECTDSNILTYSENIRAAGTTLLGLINDILDFSKIEAGKMEIIPVDYDLAETLTALVNMIRPRAENKGLTVVTDFDPNIPKYLHGDEIRLKQVITNILTNAVKYTEKGSVTFRMSFRKLEKDPDSIMLTVAVRDTGIGIKQEDMSKLFSEFERIEEKRNRTVEGTGLGMSITKSLLGMMGSALKVESVYGAGSVFSFELKQSVIKWTPVGNYETSCRSSISEHKKYREKFTAPDARVLVVDDTHMNLVVFQSLLKQTNVQIDTAESGDEGIVLALKNKYDIIFLDHMMPNKDGIETLKELKAAESGPNLDTPMICLTANAISGAREKYISAGFDDYLTKPIDSAKLEDMMYEYLPADKKKPAAVTKPPVKRRRNTLPDFIFELTEIDVFAGIKNSGNEEIFVKVLAAYAEMVPPLINEINTCYENGDTEMLIRRLGTLKSSSRTAGAEWIMRLAHKLKNAAAEGDTETLDNELGDLTNRCRWLCMDLAPIVEEEKAAEQDQRRK